MNSLTKKVPRSLLIQEIAPVDRMQKALTARFLLPAKTAIFDYLYTLRSEMDPELKRKYPDRPDKPYPQGRCLEITEAVQQEMTARMRRPSAPAERAMAAFQSAGGVIRPVWGALRGVYFQNAMQMGGLYIDVANDTVTVTKPKVEILPIDAAGLENIRDLHHFSEIAAKYWSVSAGPNHVAPHLAPLFPVILYNQQGQAQLVSTTNYMVGLMMRDRFVMAEKWVEEMPPPPPAVFARYRRRLPADIAFKDPEQGRLAAIAACREAREQCRWKDVAWRDGLARFMLENRGL